MPAVEAFLQGKIEDEEERAARSRRAANALTYGQYNLSEMLGSINECIKEDGQWQPHWIQGYRVMPVDFTAYHRPSVKNLESKAYNSEVGHATPVVQIGMIGTVGCVNGQRIALLQEVVQSETTVNQPEKETTRLYQATAKTIKEEEVAVFDAGFSVVKASESGIERCVMRLDKNCTFGRTIGQIPDKKKGQGRPPTVRRAETVRPLARHHKERTIVATPPDEVTTMRDEDGKEVTVHIWRGLYFLERHLATIQTEREKEHLRKIPVNVMVFFPP